jgi:glycosyltransferase involved in cell wall biosynthesis
MCVSLAASGHEVTLVAPGSGVRMVKGVLVAGVPFSSGRLARATVFSWRILRRALASKAEIFHFHDPELIWTGLLLRLFGKKVVFDIHENIRAQIRVKRWLPLRGLFASAFSVVDFAVQYLFYLVLAENSYTRLYRRRPDKTAVVMNFPDIEALRDFRIEDRSRVGNGIFYVGGVTVERGIRTVLDSLLLLHEQGLDFHFHCVGPVAADVRVGIIDASVYDPIRSKVTFHGPMDLPEAYALSRTCRVGLSVLLPIDNYRESYSTKVFEYMSIGLPVITSNFRLYEEVVTRHKAGLCIDPGSSADLANAIRAIFDHGDIAAQMSRNGIDAAIRHYSWRGEFDKLLELYGKLDPEKKR